MTTTEADVEVPSGPTWLMRVHHDGSVEFAPDVKLWTDGRVLRLTRKVGKEYAEIPKYPNERIWLQLFLAAERQGIVVSRPPREQRDAYGYVAEGVRPRSFNTRYVSRHPDLTPQPRALDWRPHRNGVVPQTLHSFRLDLPKENRS